MDKLSFFTKLYSEKEVEYKPLYYILGEYFEEDSILCHNKLKDGLYRYEWIPLKYLTPVDNILFIRQDQYDSYLIDKTQEELNRCLDSATFWEIHRTINITRK